ncbi:MAG: hypothetical protein KJ720_03410 [Proteobacteria bacterium]|nr:hypothetical protein [Pseudomonadota bacterium]MBU1449802.1 hypothetical protein [Pseudomonadota bacterium]MBU2468181.1 hypothetical protein [Pseudomonadota bacterium]MBU2516506.1 hypothetical protein [Pseudomonadota bacterium]
MTPQANSNRPACFGDLERVFPNGSKGLREVAAGCWDCNHRLDCLRVAASGQGGEALAEEKARRGDPEGMVGFMRRWSRRKTASRREDS